MRFSRIAMPLLLLVISGIAILGWLLSQPEPPAILAPLIGGIAPTPVVSIATRLPITPRLPGNATSRTTPTPRPTLSDAAPLPTLTPATAESHEPLPPLVFARHGQIWRSDGTGAQPQQLTSFDTTIVPSHPAVEANSGLITFVALVQPPVTATLPLPSSRLYVMGGDGSDMRELWAPAEGILWLPAWAPDGQSIYVHANGTLALDGEGSTSRLQIVRIALATAEQHTVVLGALDPSVTPDGKHLVYLKFADDGITMHVEISELDGSNPRRILDGTAFQGFYAPRVTPQGDRLFVAAIDGPPTDQQGVPLQPGGLLSSLLAWLAPPVAHAHGTPWELWSVQLDGSGLRRLTQFGEDLPMVACAPDGSSVAIMGYNGIYLMNQDGSNLRRIDPDGDHGGLVWVR